LLVFELTLALAGVNPAAPTSVVVVKISAKIQIADFLMRFSHLDHEIGIAQL
jgi:hypothetical protein